ncbi:PIN domain-like protein [Lentinula raphanica]|uniref:PIN domain-like protein n=1 Tax=Lentinula raphanica TaxID=153919 RepID=A0AA38P6P0_9AGAR|nr:PIN domain-like protein [Lentinula raphanica]
MGVKSLWTLLTPVGRPVMLENMEGKVVAIDSSIWIYQFQATMRAKDGRALVNAHILGFLRRICKLLFYGMKPVFVFDGGAPALKRETLNDRRKKKSGAAASHVKLAERLLSAQLRREALKHVKPTKGKGKAPEGPVDLNDDMVYLEDLDPSVTTTPRKQVSKAKQPHSSGKKNKFHDHDPYRLPEVNMEERVAVATRSSAPDPRLATEEELRSFIENMRPEDFDVTSPAFRELPTEVQYEIVGDLRLKSRQTSYTRLQQMLKSAPTPLDFSKQQIKNLKQRNSLTQQLLTTTDSIGKAHISIPVRIASERNREYMLIRNEGAVGGWILGIRDEGTKQKPIVIDHEEVVVQDNAGETVNDSDEDDGMEEVDIPAEHQVAVDDDLRAFHRQNALSAISRTYSQKPLAPLRTKGSQNSSQVPLFDPEDDDAEDDESLPTAGQDYWEEDEELAFAIQESIDYSNNLYSSMEASSSSSISRAPLEPHRLANPQDALGSGSRLETALSIANAGPPRNTDRGPLHAPTSFGLPILLQTATKLPPVMKLTSDNASSSAAKVVSSDLSISHKSPSNQRSLQSPPTNSTRSSSEFTIPRSLENAVGVEENASVEILDEPTDTTPERSSGESPETPPIKSLESDASSETISMPPVENMEEKVTEAQSLSSGKQTPLATWLASNDDEDDDDDMVEISFDESSAVMVDAVIRQEEQATTSTVSLTPIQQDIIVDSDEPEPGLFHSGIPLPEKDLDVSDGSRPPTPPLEPEHWDAAHEMNLDAEEGDFAHLVSQFKGRDIEDVRREIDAEIASLDQQRKNAMRDAEDVNQQMIAQIMMMLRLFGIPYITAPMEAEAQCAELLALNLVDAIITDDSDVFLFGGHRVFKNMFNQSKTVECFLLSDLSRELGLDQGTLIRLAYLLGSDYVEGLPGVGPVVAMELLKEFPGDDGLHKFKDWWLKVQSGKDNGDDSSSPFRKRFKKKFKNLYLSSDWPNPAVRDAYYHPTVDSSDEPFKWGLPDLDALRSFLNEELSWNQSKVDDLLLPIIQKVGKRNQANAMNRQGNLNDFFDVSAGSGSAAPRKRQAYASKRLQQVVSDFRKKRKSSSSSSPAEPYVEDDDGEQSEISKDKPPPRKKPRASKKGGTATKSKKPIARKRRVSGTQEIHKEVPSEEEDDGPSGKEFEADSTIQPPPLAVKLRPRPKPRPPGWNPGDSAEQ